MDVMKLASILERFSPPPNRRRERRFRLPLPPLTQLLPLSTNTNQLNGGYTSSFNNQKYIPCDRVHYKVLSMYLVQTMSTFLKDAAVPLPMIRNILLHGESTLLVSI